MIMTKKMNQHMIKQQKNLEKALLIKTFNLSLLELIIYQFLMKKKLDLFFLNKYTVQIKLI